MAALASLLPKPIHTTISSDDEEETTTSTAVLAPRATIPPYGQRKGWRPSKQEDFGDGGSYPECHLAQYPLEMGRKKA
ncbi:mRNA splicing protein, partial [Tulasnella sp. 417]